MDSSPLHTQLLKRQVRWILLSSDNEGSRAPEVQDNPVSDGVFAAVDEETEGAKPMEQQ